jgi:hypothetical protein
MSKKVAFTYQIDGVFNTVNYYLSESPMLLESMPEPKKTGITELSYTDTTLELNKTYYARFASVGGAEIKISDEVQFNTNVELFDPVSLVAVKIQLDDKSTANTTSTSEVYSWVDRKSGYAFVRDIAYSPGPSLIDANLNGRKILRFSNSLLMCNAATLMAEWKNKGKIWTFAVYKDTVNSLSDKTVFGITTYDESAGFSVQSGGSLTTARNRPYFFTRKSGAELYAELNATVAKNNIWTMSYYEADFTQKRLRIISDGGSPVVKDNAFDNISNTENSNSSGFSIGAINRYLSQIFKGDVACIIFGSGLLPTTDEINKIFGWAAHNYGLVVSLPTTHPYKTSQPIV